MPHIPQFFRDKLGDEAEQLLGEFCTTYYTSRNDDACIKLISPDINIRKMQLQIALGVNYNSRGSQGHWHSNRLQLQEALIRSIDDPSFLTSLLWDFIIVVNDGGQQPRPNTSLTIALLIKAGANPHDNHLDINYDAPHLEYINNYYSGHTNLIEHVKVWNNDEAKRMVDALEQSDQVPSKVTVETVYRSLMGKIYGYTDDLLVKKAIAEELVSKWGITTATLPQLILRVKQQFLSLKENWPFHHSNLKTLSKQLRNAQAAVLEVIYQQEHKPEQLILKKIYTSLYFSFLVLPLVYTAYLAISRAWMMSRTQYTVSAEDMSAEKLSEKMSVKFDLFKPLNDEQMIQRIEQNYSNNDSVKSEHGETKLRSAIVFNRPGYNKLSPLVTDSLASLMVPHVFQIVSQTD